MIKQLSLHNYRNLNLQVDLSPAGNLLVAPNSSGKSNLLEAIYLSAVGHSFRSTNSWLEFIGGNSEFAKASLTYADRTALDIVITAEPRQERKFILDGKHRTPSKIIGRYPAILFAPHSVDLVANDPAGRRNDLDDFLSLYRSDYYAQLARYNKLLKNRNALLKNLREFPGDKAQLTYWSQQISEVGGEIMRARLEFMRQIAEFMQETAAEVYHYTAPVFSAAYMGDKAVLSAQREWSDYLLEKFSANQDKEIAAGQTLYGPHKHDYQLLLDGRDLRYFGSRGQQRLAVLIWKLAQQRFLAAVTNSPAPLLIDDLMSELDQEHRERVARFLLTHEYQFVITAADERDIPEVLFSKAQRISL